MPPTSPSLMYVAIQAVHKYRPLMNDPNVMGMAVGNKITGGKDTGELVVTIFVAHKVDRALIQPSAMLPSKLAAHGLEVSTDVVELKGPIYPQANTARIRPARPGTSIGEVSVTAGTFGAVVYDNQDNRAPQILSNNHVLAATNAAAKGAQILQPGALDGGVAPADTIAKLTRFIELYADDTGRTNTVDAAIAKPLDASLIDNTPLDNVPSPSKSNPAVGLLFAGDGSTMSVYSPIDTVLNALDVSLASNDCSTAPVIGMTLMKTGRTTGRTQGKITHVNAAMKVYYADLNRGLGGNAAFTGLFLTEFMSMPGDSGSVGVKV